MTKSPNAQSPPDGVILFSGYNQRSVIAMCRTLEACGINYHIIAHTLNDTIYLTSYASRIACIRNNPQLDIDDICQCLEFVRAGSSKRFVIAPTSEAMNLFLLSCRVKIEQTGDIIPLVSESLYQTISNKADFISLCRQYDISVPEQLTCSDKPTLPVVAKPYHEATPDGQRLYPILIYTEQDWNKFSTDQNFDLYFLQRYIQGPSYYLQYYIHSSGQIDKFSMRNLVQQPEGKSIVAAEPATMHLDKSYCVFERLFQDVGFRGLIMIELMLEDGQFYMIEANPRMWGPAQLMVDAGVNLYSSFVNDYFNLDLPLDICGRSKNVLYFWWAGFWAPQLQGQPMKWHCSYDEFWRSYREFVDSEIYSREDTYQVFQHEARSLPVPT